MINVKLQLQSAAVTHSGEWREQNEDVVYHVCHTHPAGSDLGLFMVSDGLGGHENGEEASRLAVQTVEESMYRPLLAEYANGSTTHWQRLVHEAVVEANRIVFQKAEYRGCKMGATLALAIIVGGSAYVANVGDSRVYHWRRGELQRVTEDHSMAAELARMNQINEDEIASHPRANLLWRALGQQETVDVDLFWQPLEDGDRLLLCSDGLWKAFPEPAELADHIGRPVPMLNICEQLVKTALVRDGSDDTSAVMVQVRALAPSAWMEALTSSTAAEEMEQALVDLVPA